MLIFPVPQVVDQAFCEVNLESPHHHVGKKRYIRSDDQSHPELQVAYTIIGRSAQLTNVPHFMDENKQPIDDHLQTMNYEADIVKVKRVFK